MMTGNTRYYTVKISENLLSEIDQALDDRGLYLEDAHIDDFGNEEEYRRAVFDHNLARFEWRRVQAEVSRT